MEKNNVVLPAWYESTQGPQISATVKALSLLLVPVLKDLFGVEIGSETVDHVVDAALILIFAGVALYGHVRAKKALGAQISRLKSENERLGAAQ